MYWSLSFCVIIFCVAPTNEQRRAIVHYPLTSPEESPPVSENPLSSSINSIQTGREELTGYHRGEPGLGGTYRRGYQKTTTPDYFKGSITKGDSISAGKVQHETEPLEPEEQANIRLNRNDDNVDGAKAGGGPTENRRGDGHTVITKDKRSSEFESSSPSTVRPLELGNSGAGRSSQSKSEDKERMDIHKGTSVREGASTREQDRRTNAQDSRRQTSTPSSSSARFNTSLRESSDRNREELSEKSRHERLNRERRPTISTETPRPHRAATRSASDKSQITTHTSAPRIIDAQRYNKTEHVSVSTPSNERKVPMDDRDSFRYVGDEKKDLDGDSNLREKVYPEEMKGINSTVINKPTHLLIGEERLVQASRSPDVYSDEFRAGSKDTLNEKVGSDTEKSSGGGERIYAERPYLRDDDEDRSPGHRGSDIDRDYNRRHRDDRYDDRPYTERPTKDSQADRDRIRNITYNAQDKAGSRSSRPRDVGYDDEYKDDVYPYRDAAKDGDSIRKDRTREGRRPYTTTDDVDDRYAGGSRSYRDYADDQRYRDDRVSVGRDDTRTYRDEDTTKYGGDVNRTYDGYEDTDRYHDDYNRRYEVGGEPKGYEDSSTRRYSSSGSRRYDDDDEVRRIPSEYNRPIRRYKDETDYTYNTTQRYKDNYDGYRDDYRRSSGESESSRRYDDRDRTRDSRYSYEDGRAYSTRDNDRRYTRRDNGGTRQRDSTRKYGTDDAPRYRGEGDDGRRYRDETRVYSESSRRDRYDQDGRRTYETTDELPYVEPPVYAERSETNTRRDYDVKESNGTGRSRVDESYRSPSYAEDQYYNNPGSSGNVDRYDDNYRPRRRTGDDSVVLPHGDVDNRRNTPKTSDEHHRDRDRVYLDTSTSRRRADADDIRKDRSRGYDEDRYSDRSRGDSRDDRTYQRRTDDEYVPGSTDRVKDYDARVYRDSDEDVDTRRSRGDEEVTDRYVSGGRGRDRTRTSGERTRDKDYTDRRYEDRYRDETDGTRRYPDEDERYRYSSSDDGKVQYKDTERRTRGNPRYRDDYDRPYDRESNSPRNTDERRRGGDRSNRRDDRYIDSHPDLDEKVPVKDSAKTDATRRVDVKSESPSLRNDESLTKGVRSDPYSDERRGDGKPAEARDIQTDVRIPRTEYTPRTEEALEKPSVSEPRPDTLDKGDFSRGRRTPFYHEDDKTDSDRDDFTKGSRDDRRSSRTQESKESPFTPDGKSRGSMYETRDVRQRAPEGRTYSNRRETPETTRHKPKDEIPVSRLPTDLLPVADEPEYSETASDLPKLPVSQSDERTQRRRYSSTSTYDRGSRRRLPSVREPDVDRTRREESEDSSLPDNRGRYRYTKSRGDREDFVRDAEDGSFATTEYNPRGKGPKDDRRDMPKGEYGSPGSGTPSRTKDDRIPGDLPGHPGKEEYYPSGRDKVPSRSSKGVDDSRAHRDYDRRDKGLRDRDDIGRDERGMMYEKVDRPRSPSQEDDKIRELNITREHVDTPTGEVRGNRQSEPTFLVVSQASQVVRDQGISRSATPIPNYPEKDFVVRNTPGKSISDKIPGTAINREKRYPYDDHFTTNTTSRNLTGVNDELSKRPITTKEVIDAAYRHSDDTEKQREIFYPVYVPGSGNMTSPDIIRPSERRGITTPTKKKKKK